MSIMDQLRSNSRIKATTILSDSTMFSNKSICQTPIPMLNTALGGTIDSGITSGLTVIAGPSKHFKSLLAMIMAAAYLDKHKDAVMLFYDTEFGMPESYFESLHIDRSRVLHIPIMNIEEIKFDLVNQLENLKTTDKVFIMVDSIGNIASKKEIDDSKKESSAADMTRAKQLKSLFRMVTPYLTMKDLPMVAINHTYQEMGLFPKAIVSGGTGVYYSSNTIFIMGRRQEKKGKDVIGYDFVINVEKSRFVKEKSKIPITVSWDEGISKWSGMLDVALEGGYVIKPSAGRYQSFDPTLDTLLNERKFYRKELGDDFWELILEKTNFAQYISEKYTLAHRSLIREDTNEED